MPVTAPVVTSRPAPPPSLIGLRSPWADEEDDVDAASDPGSEDVSSREATRTRASQSEIVDRPFNFADEEGEKTDEISVAGFRPGSRAPVTPDGKPPSDTPASYLDAPEFTTEPTIPDEPTAAGEGGSDDAGFEREPTPLDMSLTGPSVLVVEDDPTFRAFLRESLTQQGYRVHTAINASNALRLLKTGEPIDLVISDLNMPHMDGFELKHEIDRWLNKAMPFIVCTADPTEDKIQTAAQVGAAALVPKPIEDLDAFFAIVLDTLRDAKVVS